MAPPTTTPLTVSSRMSISQLLNPIETSEQVTPNAPAETDVTFEQSLIYHLRRGTGYVTGTTTCMTNLTDFIKEHSDPKKTPSKKHPTVGPETGFDAVKASGAPVIQTPIYKRWELEKMIEAMDEKRRIENDKSTRRPTAPRLESVAAAAATTDETEDEDLDDATPSPSRKRARPAASAAVTTAPATTNDIATTTTTASSSGWTAINDNVPNAYAPTANIRASIPTPPKGLAGTGMTRKGVAAASAAANTKKGKAKAAAAAEEEEEKPIVTRSGRVSKRKRHFD
ncbi:MAG: hypothetical protein Q9222_005566 [Ikaeria aurantiellina]